MRYFFVSALLVFSLRIQSQGFQVNLQGQKQQGMASAGTALIQDASALFFNPGGVSFLSYNSVNLGLTPTIPNSIFLNSGTNLVSRTNSPISTPFAAYAMYGLKDSSAIKFGLAVYTPFGSTVKWEDNWTGRFALTQLQLQAIFYQPTISYKINHKLGIGAGFIYSSGKFNLQKDLPIIDANGDFGSAELDGKANGMGYNVGIYFKPVSKLSLGFTYRSKIKMDVDNGTATFKVPESLRANFPEGSFKSSLPFPNVTTIGFAYNLCKKLDVAADINYVGWKAYDTLAFDYEFNTTSLTDTKLARNYKNTFAFRVGAQYKITEVFVSRVGLAYGLTPVQNGYVTPETPDANRFVFTTGFSYSFNKHFQMDASFLFTTFKRSDINLETNLSGTFKTTVLAPGISLIYNY
jgi:long-chain fatty acid transport protein